MDGGDRGQREAHVQGRGCRATIRANITARVNFKLGHYQSLTEIGRSYFIKAWWHNGLQKSGVHGGVHEPFA